jgi:16S rRNA G527 N7-methylase RsmG
MTNEKSQQVFEDAEMNQILEELLAKDEPITARAVARLHPKLSAASSITRHPARAKLLEHYQQRQEQYRRWSGKLSKQSKAVTSVAMADKDLRIAELEKQVALLTASHVAMIRAVGEMGGFSKWAQFFADYRESRLELERLGALPLADVSQISASGQKK